MLFIYRYMRRLAANVPVIFGAMFWIVFASSNVAADEERRISLEETTALALTNSPRLQDLDFAFADRVAEAIEIRTRPNPELDVLGKGSEGGGAGVEVEITQPLRWSDFGARSVYAGAIEQAATIEQRAGLFEITAAATELFYALWLTQAQIDVTKYAANEAQRITNEVKTARQTGDRPLSDFNLFEAEVERWTQETNALRAAKARISSRLAVEIGLAGVSLDANAPQLIPISKAAELYSSFAQANAYGRKMAVAAKKSAQQRLAVASKDRWPTAGPKLFFEDAPGSDGLDWGVGVSVAVPLWDRNKSELSRARAELNAADIRLRLLEQGNQEALVRGRHNEALLLSDRALAYEGRIVPAYEDNYGRLRSMFARGQATLLDLWQVQQGLIEVRTQALTAQREALDARLGLERLIGGKIEEVTP